MPDSYTKLLLHCDGVDGSTDFPDASLSNHTVTANGDAQVDTAQQKFGTGSLLLDGTGDYLSIPDSSDWALGDTFTIDFQVRFNFVDETKYFLGQYGGSTAYWVPMLYQGNSLGWGANGVNYSCGSWAPTLNQWYHLAWESDANTLTCYVDGTVLGSTVTIPTIGDFSANLTIGQIASVHYVDGWMDEIRISKGIVRWGSNFTPPSAPYNGATRGVPLWWGRRTGG